MINSVLRIKFIRNLLTYTHSQTTKFTIMKKLLLIAFSSLAALSYAQEGSWYIGGGVGFMSDYWKVAPEIGTWVADDLQLGLVGTFESIDDEVNVAPHLYFRKWWTVGERFSLYVGANARFNSNPNYEEGGDSVFDGFLDTGFAYAVAERWGIVGRVASVGYIDDDFTFDFNMSPQSLFNVGIYWTFIQ